MLCEFFRGIFATDRYKDYGCCQQSVGERSCRTILDLLRKKSEERGHGRDGLAGTSHLTSPWVPQTTFKDSGFGYLVPPNNLKVFWKSRLSGGARKQHFINLCCFAARPGSVPIVKENINKSITFLASWMLELKVGHVIDAAIYDYP